MSTVYTNLSTSFLVEQAVLRGEGQLQDNGAFVVETGRRTGRSPMDRFIVDEAETHSKVHWGSVNRPFDLENLKHCGRASKPTPKSTTNLFRKCM